MPLKTSWQRTCRHSQDGYALLVLLLVIAMIIIFAGALVPSITFEIKRDREEEMIHRGAQYARAIRLFYRKFGRYPTKLEDLEGANNTRFLRRRYKDPVAGQDFRLLHFGEVSRSHFGEGIPGASPIASPDGRIPAGGQQSTGVDNDAGIAQSSGVGGTNSPFGGQSSQAASNQAPGSDSLQSASQGAQSSVSGFESSPNFGHPPSGQIGGGPIAGVVSRSKNDGIREFDHKRKYNEWQFVFDPSIGVLPTVPNQRPAFFSAPPPMPDSGFGAPVAPSSGNPEYTSNPAGQTSTGNPTKEPVNPPEQ